MGNFRKDSRGGRDRKSSMHKATCSECGNSCEVPFKPTGSKPVFCNDCFRGSDQGRSNNRGHRRNDRGNKQMYEATCSECGNSCEVPFKPTGSKPVFCSACFENNDGGTDSSNKQFEILNDKLDEILKVLKPTVIKDILLNKEKEDKKKPVKKTAKKGATKTKNKPAIKKKTNKKAPAKKKSVTKKTVAKNK